VTAANLGLCLAELRHLRVAVVDLDFRTRGLTAMLGLEGMPGMAEVIRGQEPVAEMCVPLVRRNLHVLPAGAIGDDTPGSLLGAERLPRVFRELAERFHYVLVDTPPIHDAADAGVIAPWCHSVLMVVRMNRTPEPWIRRSVRRLQANQVAIEGCILTDCKDESVAALCSEGEELSPDSGF
jgi:Mrp family chromosome partitioning ATPase